MQCPSVVVEYLVWDIVNIALTVGTLSHSERCNAHIQCTCIKGAVGIQLFIFNKGNGTLM